MEQNGLKKRSRQAIPEQNHSSKAGTTDKMKDPHPAGEIKHNEAVQLVRMVLFASWFIACLASIHVTQLVGAPLYYINKDYFYAYMALTKKSFGIVIITITQWFSPTRVRVSGDASVRGQLRLNADGMLDTDFPPRLVMLANHQLYTDWLYLWWIAYTSQMHGHIYIVLKESLKYVPFIGPGMMFFGFIFMARKWASDKLRLKYRLDKLNAQHAGPLSGSAGLDPMWFLMYPEGTNLSANTRKRSKAWAEKQGIPDLHHLLLPRSTGLFFCLHQLKGTVDWVYDCTVAYEGTPIDGYAQDYFTLRSTYFQGRPPKSVNMYWRRFAMADIPLNEPEEFEAWMNDRWQEKEQLLALFKQTGRFPSDESGIIQNGKSGTGYIQTEVRLVKWYEVGEIFVVLAATVLVANVITKLWSIMTRLLRQ